MQRFKDELEDLAFAQLNPDAWDSILTRARISQAQQRRGSARPHRRAARPRTGKDGGVEPGSPGRVKSPYSIWRKMQRFNVAFEQLVRLMAFRVVVATVGDCYHALWVCCTAAIPVVPGRFKDYISTPKPNGYRSLHTGLIGPGAPAHRGTDPDPRDARGRRVRRRRPLEVQARRPDQVDGRQYRWLRELLDILEQASNPEEFLEHTKLEMFQDQVFCFTPKGDLIACRAGRRRSISPMPCTPRSATPASAPRSTAACCRCAACSRTATRSRSSPHAPSARRPTGRPSSSPARPSHAFAG